MRHSEISIGHFPQIRALLVGNDGKDSAVELAESSDDGRVIAEAPITVKLDKIVKEGSDIMGGFGAVDMPGW
jgi:hypothetical protein